METHSIIIKNMISDQQWPLILQNKQKYTTETTQLRDSANYQIPQNGENGLQYRYCWFDNSPFIGVDATIEIGAPGSEVLKRFLIQQTSSKVNESTSYLESCFSSARFERFCSGLEDVVVQGSALVHKVIKFPQDQLSREFVILLQLVQISQNKLLINGSNFQGIDGVEFTKRGDVRGSLSFQLEIEQMEGFAQTKFFYYCDPNGLIPSHLLIELLDQQLSGLTDIKRQCGDRIIPQKVDILQESDQKRTNSQIVTNFNDFSKNIKNPVLNSNLNLLNSRYENPYSKSGFVPVVDINVQQDNELLQSELYYQTISAQNFGLSQKFQKIFLEMPVFFSRQNELNNAVRHNDLIQFLSLICGVMATDYVALVQSSYFKSNIEQLISLIQLIPYDEFIKEHVIKQFSAISRLYFNKTLENEVLSALSDLIKFLMKFSQIKSTSLNINDEIDNQRYGTKTYQKIQVQDDIIQKQDKIESPQNIPLPEPSPKKDPPKNIVQEKIVQQPQVTEKAVSTQQQSKMAETASSPMPQKKPKKAQPQSLAVSNGLTTVDKTYNFLTQHKRTVRETKKVEIEIAESDDEGAELLQTIHQKKIQLNQKIEIVIRQNATRNSVLRVFVKLLQQIAQCSFSDVIRYFQKKKYHKTCEDAMAYINQQVAQENKYQISYFVLMNTNAIYTLLQVEKQKLFSYVKDFSNIKANVIQELKIKEIIYAILYVIKLLNWTIVAENNDLELFDESGEIIDLSQ